MRPFTFVVIFGCIATLGLVVTIAMRHFDYDPGRERMSSNESGAISVLRTVSSAQELYNTRYGTYGTPAQLEAADMIHGDFTKATIAASSIAGYCFKMVVGDKAWCCGARAAQWGVDGKRSFRISQDGYIYYSEKDEDLTITTSGTRLGG